MSACRWLAARPAIGSSTMNDSMEHEATRQIPVGRPEATDACGCTPHTPPESRAPSPVDPPPIAREATAASVDTVAPRRPLKLVVTFTPADGGLYRAALALGSEGCDPVLQSCTVSTLSDALERVPDLLEEAEARWHRHPRNPAVVRGPSRQPAADRSRPEAVVRPPDADERDPAGRPLRQAETEPPLPLATEPAASTTRPAGGQLTLFG